MPGHGQPGGHPLEVFDHAEPQHDGDRPQFAEFQRGGPLVGRHKRAERPDVHLGIHVRDQLQHQVVNPREPRGWTRHEARQFPAVALGQVAAREVNLLLDEVKIIQQPFRRRRDVPRGVDQQGRAVELAEPLLIFLQPGQQAV